MQWKMCANGLSFPDSRSPSTSPTKASDSSVNFADLKSSVSGVRSNFHLTTNKWINCGAVVLAVITRAESQMNLLSNFKYS